MGPGGEEVKSRAGPWAGVVSQEVHRATRAAIERRLALERAGFFGLLAVFFALLFAGGTGDPAANPLLWVLILIVAVVGAGYEGAREALRDLDLIAGLLEREGAGARVAGMPFFMRGHYEIEFEAPAPAGPRRFSLSFANAVLKGARGSVFLISVPLPGGAPPGEGTPAPQPPYIEMATSGAAEGKRLEYVLWAPRRGGPREWRLLLYVKPGRPMDVEALADFRGRAGQMAAKISREGVGAIPWGKQERFRKPTAQEMPEGGRVQLVQPGDRP